jgi:2-oxo-3-hexenedioate decarboxylase
MIGNEISSLASLLDTAMLEVREVERLTLLHPDLNIHDAYLIQDEGIKLRYARGEKLIGYKMGLTSQAKREQMNLDLPIYGVLTDQMEIVEGEKFSLAKSIHARIEPEIAFIIGREIRGAVTAEQALEHCSGVCAAMEILDSRFLNFKYFSLPDVVADNSSSAYFVISKNIKKPQEVDFSNLEMVMSIDGAPVQRAFSSAISGHPLNSLVQLCELLNARGINIPAGSVVLAGAATQAVPLAAGNLVSLTVEKLGTLAVEISKNV